MRALRCETGMRRALAWAVVAAGSIGCSEHAPSSSTVAFHQAPRGAAPALETEFQAATLGMVAKVTQSGELSVAPALNDDAIPCRFKTLGVGRSSELPARSAAATLNPQGRIAIPRGDALETVEARADGLEQQWQFLAMPRGSGDLLARLSVAGCELAVSGEDGLHFRPQSSARGIVYGKAFWIDAAGARVPLVTSFNRGELTIRVSASVLEQSRYPASLDPTLSPESDVDAPVLVDPPQTALIAPGNGQYAVAFGDRLGLVSSAGAVLTPVNGLPISFPSGERFAPSQLVFNGQYYLAVAVRPKPPSTPEPGGGFSFGGDIYGVRISSDAQVLDSAPFVLVDSAFHHDDSPSLASDGAGNFLLTYQSYDAPAGLTFRLAAAILRPTANGMLAATPLTPLATDVRSSGPNPAMQATYDGTNYAVAYTHQPSIIPRFYRRVISPDGIVVSPTIVSTDSAGVAVVGTAPIRSGGGQTLVVPAGQAYLYVSSSYVPRGPAVTLPYAVTRDSFAFNGANFQFVWRPSPSASSGISTVQVKPDGTGTAVSTQASPVFASTPRIACLPGQCLVVAGGLGTRLNATGIALDNPPFRIMGNANAQRNAVVASGASGYLLSWYDALSGGRVARLSNAGAIASSAFASSGRLSARALGDTFFSTQIEFDAQLKSSVTVSRFNADGVAQGSPGQVLAPARDADLACAGSACLLVWSATDESVPTQTRVLAARVDSTSAFIDPSPMILDPGSSGIASVRVGTDGSQFLATWIRAGNLNAARITAAGAVLDTTPIVTPAGAISAIAGSASEFLVEARNGQELKAFRITQSGGLVDPVPFSIADNTSWSLLSSYADGFVAIWADPLANLKGMFITTAGTKSCPFLLAANFQGQLPSLARGSDGKLLLAYSRFRSDPGYNADRVETRTLELSAADQQAAPSQGCPSEGSSGGGGAPGVGASGGDASAAGGSLSGLGGAPSGGLGGGAPSGALGGGSSVSGAGGDAGLASDAGASGEGQPNAGDGGMSSSEANGGSTGLGGAEVGGSNTSVGGAGQPATGGATTPPSDSGCSLSRGRSENGVMSWAALSLLLVLARSRRRPFSRCRPFEGRAPCGRNRKKSAPPSALRARTASARPVLLDRCRSP